MNTILWLHGFPFTSAIFAKQLAIEGVRHVMPDLPARDTMEDYAKFAIEQLDERGIASATFAGLSMGGYICFAALRLFPERVSGLILIDTRETADTEEQRNQRFAMIETAQREGTGPIVEAMLPKMLTANAPDDLREYVREVMTSAPRDYVIGALRAMAARPDSSALLPQIRVPALIAVGEEDPITPPADAERMARAIPNARLVKLAGAAHVSNVERAEEFNAAVRA